MSCASCNVLMLVLRMYSSQLYAAPAQMNQYNPEE